MRYSILALVLALAPLAEPADAAMPRRSATAFANARHYNRNATHRYANNACYDAGVNSNGSIWVNGNSVVRLPDGTILYGTNPDLYWPPYIWNANNWSNNGRGWTNCNNGGRFNNGRNFTTNCRTSFRNHRNRF